MSATLLQHSHKNLEGAGKSKKFLIPLDVNTPTSNPLDAQAILNWALEHLINPGDEVILVSHLNEQVSSSKDLTKYVLAAAEWLSGESMAKDFSCGDLCQSTLNLLERYACKLREYKAKVEVSVHQGNVTTVHWIQDNIEKYSPDIVLLPSRKDQQAHSVVGGYEGLFKRLVGSEDLESLPLNLQTSSMPAFVLLPVIHK